MKLYLYDFDGTIYDGDSSVDFFKYCLKKEPQLKRMLPKIALKFLKYKLKLITVTELKEYIFSFVKYFEDIDKEVKNFWKVNKNKLKSFYMIKDHKNDIIISASPEFLLKPICDELKVKNLIASDVDKKTGHFNKENNYKEEKVRRFRELYKDDIIEEMYSDSLNDKPLLDLANKSYFIKKNTIYEYRTYKPNLIIRLWNWCWSIYHKKEEVWNYLIVGGLTTVVSIATFGICSKVMALDLITSNILSWICAVLFAYYTNRLFVFKSKNKNITKEFISFTGSRVLTLLLDTGLMVLMVKSMKIDELIAKIIVQFVIVIANYIISKLIVFKKNKE